MKLAFALLALAVVVAAVAVLMPLWANARGGCRGWWVFPPLPALLLALAAASLLATSGCSFTSGSVAVGPDGRPTGVKLTTFNFIDDRALTYSRNDGTSSVTLGYNNNPNETGQAAAFAAIGKALDKIPAVPVAPVP